MYASLAHTPQPTGDVTGRVYMLKFNGGIFTLVYLKACSLNVTNAISDF